MQIKRLNNPQTVSFTVDTALFSEKVITKTAYWLSSDYSIDFEKNDNEITVILKKKCDEWSDEEIDHLKSRIGQNLIDFKTREIVAEETKAIRELLLVKAFASTDEFDEVNFIEE